MADNTFVAIGLIIGLLFGMSGIATLFNFMNMAMEETAQQLAQIGAVSTLVLLVIALILIIKIRIISSLIVGAVIGAVLNIILEMNGINITNDVFQAIARGLGL
ncbi:hypothetical protein [Geoglobus acetivorans]|uniref:Uncharacterized protein n=1 Tax=Geoglobus acetivorans TaxID=565033 RepID=A0A0A7GAU4_GEOAI|nr:hypothetical protein GACE_0103 [Geoglobus acetivorans]